MTHVRGWVAALMALAALLVFGPLGLYLWANGGPREAPGPAASVSVTGCRIDPATRRALARVEVVGDGTGPAARAVRVSFRQGESGPVTETLVEVPPVPAGEVAETEAIGPAWPRWTPGLVPWCAAATTDPAPPSRGR
ncbi:hypothetical protein [Streptomyces sp. NPDC090022]|uniref:hypothetical protein n=1 Tax=Streptomyces sp. NPDC090022 TaxID=3365920 RepID=UPI00382E3702